MHKVCKKCDSSKPLSEYYRQRQMADGHLNVCKSCTKARVRGHRSENLERIRAYDRARGRTEKRKAKCREYRRNHPDIVHAAQQRWSRANRHKTRAQLQARRAILSGKLTRGPCEVCGTTQDIHAHHDDYGRPLAVRWLCMKHHREAHRQYA